MGGDFQGQTAAEEGLQQLLSALNAGRPPEAIERANAEVKEAPGRRARDGSVLPGPRQSEDAARFLWSELACMSNTPDGGAIVLGVADDGTRVGTSLDPEWLRHRIYELSGGRLTADIQPHHLDDGTPVLLCRVPQAVEPHRVNGRVHWRVDDNCVEVDPATWHARVAFRYYDWSAEPSDRTLRDVDPLAIAVARRFIAGSGDDAAAELVDAPDHEFLRRIPNVVGPDDRLTNAGRLLFTDVPPALDYRHREVAGGDSTVRVNSPGPVLAQLQRVFDTLEARRRTVHLPGSSPAVTQMDALPLRSAREAIVNGIVHREWTGRTATEVEHVGDVLRVTSPGGLIGTVTPANIITHPSTPRHRALAEAANKLHLTEREGIGVDRMFVDLLAMGRPRPEISEEPGPMVRTTLAGGDPDPAWVHLRLGLNPSRLGWDLNALIALEQATDEGWVDARQLADRIQDREVVAAETLRQLSDAHADGSLVIEPVEGQPGDRRDIAWRLSDSARSRLAPRTQRALATEARQGLLIRYAERYGRISSTEAASLAGVSAPIASETLKELEAENRLIPSRQNRRGRGFHYRLPS